MCKMMLCPKCGEEKVSRVKGIEPWSCDHLQCSACDSTFVDDEKEYDKLVLGYYIRKTSEESLDKGDVE